MQRTVCDFHPGYRCHECRQLFDTKPDLQIHVNGVHRHLETYVCCECLHEFLTTDQISRHIYEKHCIDLKQNRFSCQLCDYKTKTSQSLIRHAVTHRTSGRPFRCDVCQLRLKSEEKLNQHKRHFHSQHRIAYKCNVCPFLAISKSNLKKHALNPHSRARH